MKEHKLLLNPFFLIGLLILIVNDAFLKWEYSNMITGKLSDFAGLFIFPIFLAYMFPRFKKYLAFIVGIFFIFWKSSFSTPFIYWVNDLSFFQFNRTIDYSDLLALMVLPIAHALINNYKFNVKPERTFIKYVRVAVLIVSSLAFMATSMMRQEMPRGTVYLGKSFKVKMSKDSILNRMNDLGYEWEYLQDTVSNKDYYSHYGYYQIQNVVVEEDDIIIDTLKNVKFTLYEIKEGKTKIEIINVQLSKPGNIQDWKYLRSLSRFYKGQIKKSLIEPIKN